MSANPPHLYMMEKFQFVRVYDIIILNSIGNNRMRIKSMREIDKLPKHIRDQIKAHVGTGEGKTELKDNLGPQRELFSRVKCIWEDAEWNFRPLPDRKLELDIAIPKYMIGVEVDGWQFHGKHLSSHSRDREKQNLLQVNGWMILRFSIKHLKDDEYCVNTIREAIRCRWGDGPRG